MNWMDPFVLMATLPMKPRLYFFGPKEEDMGVGPRNRIMSWTCATVPYRPGKNDLLEATRRVSAVLASGGVLAIAGEGRIHASEHDLLRLEEGPAYFALRSGVPLVPIAISGTSWLRLGRRVRVVVGDPIEVAGRPRREAVDELTARLWTALHALVADRPDFPPPLEEQGFGWRNTFGTGMGADAITSGLEGAWTNEPTKWDNGYLDNLFDYD